MTYTKTAWKAALLCLCMFLWVCESYQHRERHSVFDGTPRSSLIFPIDFLLLSFLHSQGMGCLNWSRLVKESVRYRETDWRWGKEKRERDWGVRTEWGKCREKEEERACKLADHRGPGWPLTLMMTLEVTPEVRGCVKVPLRRFTPLLGDDDLIQPPQPVWHDQCCSLPAAPKGHTSISNPATQGPLKAPYRQSQWAGGTGTPTEKSGESKGKAVSLFSL